MNKRYSKGTFLIQVIVTVIALFYLIPFLIVILYAFKSPEEIISSSPFSLPERLEWDNFSQAFEALNFLQSFANTSIITASAVLLIILLSGMAAYSIVRGRNKFFNGAYMFFIAGILIPYQVIFVPMFVLGSKLGFINNLFGIIFLYIGTSLPFAIFVMAGFMKTIPKEIEEAAFIDGCSIMRTFWIIILPMLKPVAAALTIILSLQIWNDYLLPQLFLSDNSMKTLTVMQSTLFSAFETNFNVGFAGIIISSLPILILFVFMQKHFVKGITMGSGK